MLYDLNLASHNKNIISKIKRKYFNKQVVCLLSNFISMLLICTRSNETVGKAVTRKRFDYFVFSKPWCCYVVNFNKASHNSTKCGVKLELRKNTCF